MYVYESNAFILFFIVLTVSFEFNDLDQGKKVNMNEINKTIYCIILELYAHLMRSLQTKCRGLQIVEWQHWREKTREERHKWHNFVEISTMK